MYNKIEGINIRRQPLIESIVEIGKYVEKRGIYSHPFVQVPYDEGKKEKIKSLLILLMNAQKGNSYD